jgi:hypothetical protein
MILLARIQGREIVPAAGGNGALWILALLVLLVIHLRSRRNGPPLPPADARRALEEMEKEGRRDPRAEGHLQACLGWCRTYAVLSLLSCVAILYQAGRRPADPEEAPPDHGTLSMFGGIALLEAAGIWAGLRALRKGEPAGRWISCAALSAVSLSGAAAVTLRVLRWSEDDVFDVHVLMHGAVAVYAVAGAMFLLLPRAARLCTSEYRAMLREPETPAARAALVLARAKSPFAWIPLVALAAAFVLNVINHNRG